MGHSPISGLGRSWIRVTRGSLSRGSHEPRFWAPHKNLDSRWHDGQVKAHQVSVVDKDQDYADEGANQDTKTNLVLDKRSFSRALVLDSGQPSEPVLLFWTSEPTLPLFWTSEPMLLSLAGGPHTATRPQRPQRACLGCWGQRPRLVFPWELAPQG
jgi:hypothetical protein